MLILVRVDEWGAVIKNQSEAFKRMEEQQMRQRKDQMQNYGQELESEVFNKYRKAKDAENEEKRKEMEIAMQKKAELDNLNMSTLERKKQMQALLAQEYENMIKMKQQKNQYDRFSDLRNGQLANHKANQELNYLKQSEDQKKKMIKEVLNNAKTIHEEVKAHGSSEKQMNDYEAKRHLEEMERRERERDLAKISRYNNFNDFQNKTARAYMENVANPTMEKDMKFNQMLRKQEYEMKRKAEQDEELRNKKKKEWAMANRFGIETQIRGKNDNNQALAAQHRFDEDNTRSIERDLNNLNNMSLMDKKARQQKYKEMLDNQKRTKDVMKMYGNMTGIEKQMNKNDLSAFKNYDNKTYALIPGLNSTSNAPSKKIIEDKSHKKRERSYDEQIERMNQFGLTRDVTLVKNPHLYTQNAHRSSMDDITGHVNKSARDGRIDRTITSPAGSITKTAPLTANLTVNNFDNHHLYQSYNPINGMYSPEKKAMNQARTTFRYAGSSIIR